MLFLPIFCYLIIKLCFLTVCVVANLSSQTNDGHSDILVAIEGFWQVKLQFYLIFLTPLRIADKYRITQEVTPAGTIIAINLLVSSVLSEYIRRFAERIYVSRGYDLSYLKIVSIILGVVAVAFSFKHAVKEFKMERYRRKTLKT